jgi:hypothetical protein
MYSIATLDVRPKQQGLIRSVPARERQSSLITRNREQFNYGIYSLTLAQLSTICVMEQGNSQAIADAHPCFCIPFVFLLRKKKKVLAAITLPFSLRSIRIASPLRGAWVQARPCLRTNGSS